MFAYFKGAGASAFVATLLAPLVLFCLPQPFGYSTQGLYLVLTFTIASNYVGCVLGWILLTSLNKSRSIDTGTAVMLYVLLGCVFTAMLSFVFSYFVLVFTLIAMSGSVSFYLAQRIKNRMLSWGLILFGPFALIAASSSYLYLTLSPFM
ncbi:hypothetical protein [Paenibacillus popilliae]|uniref:Predicted permease n=1 Tax=Paenibacillus popilliae ATCC 14706 TaxID=1212764 RepID=M9LIU3_PAEPP|nr:hypothetical protein [Paenibacillus popilliae]GAC43085.1 predicted permease [Paenibacillus popilliae ATCC 14706]